MFALVKYQDGVKKIVPSSDIKCFDQTRINYSKKYKIKWDNEEYYDGVIVIVGGKYEVCNIIIPEIDYTMYNAIYFHVIFVDSKTKIEKKALQKRQKITPFEICESADDTDSSMTKKTEDKVIYSSVFVRLQEDVRHS